MARQWNGTTDELQYGRTADLEPAAITVSMLVRFPGGREGNFQYMLSKVQLDGDHTSYGFHTGDGSATNITWTIGFGATAGDFYRLDSTTPDVYDGAWHHLCGTYDPGQNPAMRFYTDGVERANAVAGNAIGYNTARPLWLGTFDGTQLNHGGVFAEVAIWNLALTAPEVAALARRFAPRLIRPQALVFYPDLIRSSNDRAGGIVPSITGTTIVEHPAIIYPARPGVGVPAVSAPPALDAVLACTLPALQGALTAEADADAALAAALPSFIGGFTAEAEVDAALAAALPGLQGLLAAEAEPEAVLTGVLPALVGQFTSSPKITQRPFTGITPRPFTGTTPRP